MYLTLNGESWECCSLIKFTVCNPSPFLDIPKEDINDSKDYLQHVHEEDALELRLCGQINWLLHYIRQVKAEKLKNHQRSKYKEA